METNQQNQDEIEIDLLELLRVLCSKIGYVILAALALGLLMVLVSKVLMKPQYESTTKMYVLSKQDSSNTVTSGDLQASSLLTKDYAELIQSRTVLDAPGEFRVASLDGFFLEALDHHGVHGLDEHGGIGEPPGDHVKNTLHIRFA